MTDYKPYLKTLRRIPAPIIQAMATRPIDVGGDVCLCGWAVREAMAFANGMTAEKYKVSEHDPMGSDDEAVRRFGGTPEEWSRLYYGIASSSKFADVEEAFAIRVAECVR